MQYTCEIEIALPRPRVIELFDDPDNLKHWQEGLQSFTHKSGTPGEPGAVSEIVFQLGKRRMEMLETIETRNLPDEFTAIYTTKGVWNRLTNHFTETTDGRTHWRQTNEFRPEGIMMRLMTTFMPGMFRKQSLAFMEAFKRFAEAQG